MRLSKGEILMMIGLRSAKRLEVMLT
jgi:hypothetical protein